MWQTFCVNTAVRDGLLHVARASGWGVPENWPADCLWVIVGNSNVDGDDIIDVDIEVVPLEEAFDLLSKGPFSVAKFDGFTVTMTIDQAEQVLSGDKNIMDELSCTLEGVPRNWIVDALGARVQIVIWRAACSILEQHYLGAT